MTESKQKEVVLKTGIPFETLDTTLDILRCLSDEAILRIGKDGLDVSLVDPANVAMHHLDVLPSAFDFTPSGQFALGINLERFQDYISKAGSGQSIDLGFDTEKRKLNIQYANKDFNVAAIDPDSIRQEPDDVDIDQPNEFVVEQSDLAEALDVVDLVSDMLRIRCQPDEERVVFYGDGDIDDVTVEFDHDDLIDARLNEETETFFSVNYLWGTGKKNAGMVRDIPDGEVRLLVGTEQPLRMFYEYADGQASVESMLAPRLDKS